MRFEKHRIPLKKDLKYLGGEQKMLPFLIYEFFRLAYTISQMYV